MLLQLLRAFDLASQPTKNPVCHNWRFLDQLHVYFDVCSVLGGVLPLLSLLSGYWRLWHSGGIMTYKSQVWLIPEINKAIYVEVNGPQTGSWAIVHIAHFIVDVLTGEEPWLNTSTVCSFPEPWRKQATHVVSRFPTAEPPYPIDHYVGAYTNEAFGRIDIKLNASDMALHLTMGRFLEGVLGYDDENREFKMRLTSHYWYLNSFIPLNITAPVCSGQTTGTPVMTVLRVPLYSPYDTATRVTFTRPSTNLVGGASVHHSVKLLHTLMLMVVQCVIK